jgi:hypothetical protein
MVSPRILPVLVCTALAPAVAFAQSNAAPPTERRSIEARKACAAGQVDRGIQLLADYLAATEDATAIYNMARCYEQNGLTDKAVLQFREYLRKAKELTAADRQEVVGHIRELEAAHAPPVPSPPQPDRPSPSSPEAGRPALRITGLALAGAGVVSIGAGVVFGLRVAHINSQLGAARAEEAPDAGHYRQLLREGRTAQTLQWVLMGTGTGMLGAGVACYFLARPAAEERAIAFAPWLSPGAAGARLEGTF